MLHNIATGLRGTRRLPFLLAVADCGGAAFVERVFRIYGSLGRSSAHGSKSRKYTLNLKPSICLDQFAV